MADRRKLIVVSNRAPVSFMRDAAGARVGRRGGGGLVTALASLVARHDVTWVASAMTEEDRAVVLEAEGGPVDETARDGSVYRLRLVAHEETAYDRYYNVIANPTLWFAQHYLWGLATAPDIDPALHHAWEEGYVTVNRGFADAVSEELEREPAATVFFHDYHLYCAPAFVRAAHPEATLAHFVHIPWPQPDYWRVLPDPIRRAVHEGLLANDLVAFHTDRWRVNFLRSCADLTDASIDFGEHEARFHGRRTAVRFSPISVDPSEFAELATSERVRDAEAELEAARPEHLILRVDRTDPSKNVVRGFRAYELFLDAHPELHRRVQMLALLDPSRQDIPDYAEYLGAIQRSARAVNDRFQQEGWQPLDLRIADDFMASIAAYKQYDVLLVNAIFDGLNLVAKEAPLVNERDGVLVLSENTGAHEELASFALTVNPFDVAGQADALYEAIVMDADERHRRLEGIRRHVQEHDIAHWIATQLAELDEARERADRTLPVP
jgi:trehalose 6-phosphate synthase